MPPHPFDRYRAITDVHALRASSARPLRKSMRVNFLKSDCHEFVSWANHQHWKIEPIPWCADGFFVDRDNRDVALGKDLLHIVGHTYMQEAASMLPVTLLDPQPGDAVLDMSAAPGSKTTHILSRMRAKGVVVANDVQEKRLWALLSNLQRSSAKNVLVTRKVGQWFARHTTERFDRVLCDAPCTAQGIVRKDATALQYCSSDNVGKMAKLQRELLEAAIHAANVGGRIVYSTCTLTPEENEEVVSSMLKKFPNHIEAIMPSSFPGIEKALNDSRIVQTQLGIAEAEQFPALRLWPHTYDTEGFFCAVFTKQAPTLSPQDFHSSQFFRDAVMPDAKVRGIGSALADWYGTSFLDSEDCLFSMKEQLLVTTRDTMAFPLPIAPYFAGMPFGRPVKESGIRLSQEVMTLSGAEATRQRVVLSLPQMNSLLRGENIKVDQHTEGDERLKNGDVALLLNADTMGESSPPRLLCICRGLHRDGSILNRLPREIVHMYA